MRKIIQKEFNESCSKGGHMKKKNRILKLAIVAFAFVIGIQQGNAATNPYKEYSSFGKNCTWFAWDQVYKRLGIALPGWHNAQDWYNDAKKSGYEVGQTPRPNSIVVWKWSSYGHVAFVEKVVGDKIYIWDSATCYDYVYTNKEEYDECILNGVSEETDKACREKYITTVPTGCEYPATYWKTPGDLIGYIYLDKVPSKTNNTNSSTSSSSSSSTTTKKSSNTNLSSITISTIDFTFHKDTYQYELEVDGIIDHIIIDAKTEDSKANVDGLGEYELEIGENTITLDVSAEDGTTNTYIINIKRKDNNANLSSLTIPGIDFTFNTDILEYTLEVPHEVEKIEVLATPESEFAKIEGAEEYLLENEQTIIEVIIKAEDNTEKTYKLTIKKEKVKNEQKQEENKKLYLWLMGVGIILFVIITFLVILLRKRKFKKQKVKSSEEKKN